MNYLKLLLIVVLFTVLSACDTENFQDLSTQESELFRLINAHREKQGLSTLKLNEYMNIEAREHSVKMGEGILTGHVGREERARRITKEVTNGEVEETIAYNQITASEVISNWTVGNLRYKAIIEGDYELAGVGVYQNQENTFYYTLLVLKPLDNLVNN